MDFLVHHFLEKYAQIAPEKEAVIHGANRFSYAEVNERACKFANWLFEKRAKKGDRVALLCRNSIDYISAYYGALKAGTVVVPLNTGLPPEEVAELLRDCGARFVVTENFFLPHLQYLSSTGMHKDLCVVIKDKLSVEEFNIPYVSLDDIYMQEIKELVRIRIIDKDMASIIYTSGSTGKPKGVMLSHLNVVTNTKSIVNYLKINDSDSCMVVLPFYYVYGKSLLNTHFAVGGKVVIDNRFTFPNAIVKTMVDEKITGFAGVPSTYSILLNKSSISKTKLPDLKYLTQAGGNMSEEIKKRLLRVFPDKKIFIMYGATEASARLSFLPPKVLDHKLRSIGIPISNVEMKIMTDEGLGAPVGDEGEIVARGTNIMIGYWRNDQETDKVLKDGWYFTGDIGRQDTEGFFYVTGRKRDMIKVGIYKVSAFEIEELLHEHPHVEEVAVIGVEDELFGEVPHAYIAMKKEGDVPDFEEMCRVRFPDYKVPKKFIIMESLPKNEAGKILKNKLIV